MEPQERCCLLSYWIYFNWVEYCFCAAKRHKYVALCMLCMSKKIVELTSCRMTLARLHLMAPMDLWQNSIPFFGAAALCATKIDNFNAPLKSVPGPSLQYLRGGVTIEKRENLGQ